MTSGFKKYTLLEFTLVWLLYLPILCYLFINASPHHNFSGYTLDWNWTIQDVIKTFAGNDLGDSSLVAYQFYRDGEFPPNAVFSFRTWPPGIYYLLSLPLFLFGENAPVIPTLSVVSIVTWSLLLLLAYDALRTRCWRIFAFALPLGIFLLPEIHNFILRAGVMNSDSYGSTTLAMGFIALFLAFERKSRRYAIIAGVAFAASAYMRSNHEQLHKIQIIGFLMIAGFEYWRAKLSQPAGWKAKFKQFIRWAKIQPNLRLGATIIIVTILVMLPWRIHNLITDGRLSWSIGVDFEIHTTWVQQPPQHWYSRSGGTVGCLVDPVTCQDFNERGLNKVRFIEKAKAYVIAFLSNPFQWYAIKLKAFYMQWVEAYDDPVSWLVDAFRHLLLLSVVALPAISALRYYNDQSMRNAGFCWAALTIGGYLFVLLTFAHIESRYLYPVKLVIFYWFLIVVTNRLKLCRKSPSLLPAAQAT